MPNQPSTALPYAPAYGSDSDTGASAHDAIPFVMCVIAAIAVVAVVAVLIYRRYRPVVGHSDRGASQTRQHGSATLPVQTAVRSRCWLASCSCAFESASAYMHSVGARHSCRTGVDI